VKNILTSLWKERKQKVRQTVNERGTEIGKSGRQKYYTDEKITKGKKTTKQKVNEKLYILLTKLNRITISSR
jgi:hypothetical protein